MKRSTKIIIPIIILILGFLSMRVLLGMREEKPRREFTAPVKNVQSVIVATGGIPAEIVAFGRVRSARPVQLISEVTGTLMRGDVPFQPGQSFRRGEVLVRIDDRQARLELNSKISELLNALATVLPEIKIDFPDEFAVWQRYFEACGFDTSLEPLPETTNQKIKLYLSRFNVYKLYFSVRDLEIMLDKHYFHAPFDGSIVSASLRVGSTARSGSVLGEMISLEDLEVEVPIKSENIGWIDRTRPVHFASAEMPGEWSGRIVRIGSDIDSRTQAIPVFISIDRSGSSELLNGAFLEAHIPGRTVADAVTVPHRALYDERYVYVIEAGALRKREVAIARREADAVIVTDGLNDGDTLVVELLKGISSGMAAKPRFADDVGGAR